LDLDQLGNIGHSSITVTQCSKVEDASSSMKYKDFEDNYGKDVRRTTASLAGRG
jgi:hypothetical protein